MPVEAPYPDAITVAELNKTQKCPRLGTTEAGAMRYLNRQVQLRGHRVHKDRVTSALVVGRAGGISPCPAATTSDISDQRAPARFSASASLSTASPLISFTLSAATCSSLAFAKSFSTSGVARRSMMESGTLD